MHGVEAVRAGDDHGREVGATSVRRRVAIGTMRFMNARATTVVDLADAALDELLADALEATPEALRVADHGVDLSRFDGPEHALGVEGVGRERLLDEQRVPMLDAGEDRLDVPVLVGGDDHRRDLGTRDQVAEVARSVVRLHVAGERAHDLLVEVAEAEPADGGVLARQFGADAPDGAAADDGEADLLRTWGDSLRAGGWPADLRIWWFERGEYTFAAGPVKDAARPADAPVRPSATRRSRGCACP